MTPQQLQQAILRVADAVIAHEPELTALDQVIGDGDHGLNMRRGFEAVRAEAETVAAKPLPDALKAIGNRLVMTVGGASGPLYGTLAIALGKELAPDASNFPKALEAAISAVMARGKSQPGQKTLIDVLLPVQEAIAAGGPRLAQRLPSVAEDAAQATASVRAFRGRASYLGECSIGHVDPGARSTSLIVAAICDGWEQ